MSYLEHFHFAIPRETEPANVILHRNRHAEIGVDTLAIGDDYGISVLHNVRPCWDYQARELSNHIHLLVDNKAGLIWVGNHVAHPKPIRLRGSNARINLLKALSDFANPGLYTVEEI